METNVIIILILSILTTITSIVALILSAKGLKKSNATVANDHKDLEDSLKKELRNIGADQSNTMTALSGMISEQMRSRDTQSHDNFDKLTNEMSKSVNGMITLTESHIQKIMESEKQSIQSVETRLEKIAQQIKESLTEIRTDNTNQLNQMREVVDEKLHKSLEERLQSSFALITDKLEKVKEGFTEMQNLSKGVTDLNKVLNGVKTRGTWGETSLQSLMEDLLAPEQYERNVTIKPNKIVEFCIKLPGNDKPVYLPIDSKFPLADYERLVQFSLDGNIEEMNKARKDLETRIKNEAKSINEYIDPPKTLDFAIMYLPIEGLYAEVTKNPELTETIRQKNKIIVAGPSTFAALLNSLQVGFRTLAIQKNSMKIQQLLAGFKTEFSKFTELLERSEKQALTLSDTLQKAIKKTTKIGEKLGSIDLPDNARDALPQDADNDDE